MQKRVNQAIAIDLLNPYLTQQEIAERNGYSQQKISIYQRDLLLKIPDIGKISKEELQEADQALCALHDR